MSTTGHDAPHEPKQPLISLPHVIGSATAAAAATAAASYFGIAGTIIGAVAASIVATVVSATSTHSLKRAPKVALSAAAALAMVMLAVTGVEGLAGKPLSSLVGHDETATGTTISRAVPGEEPARVIVKKETVVHEPVETADTTQPPRPAPADSAPVAPGQSNPSAPDTGPDTGTPAVPTPPAPDRTVTPVP